MGSCVSKRAKSPIRVVVPQPNFVENNILLDRWTEQQVKMLNSKFSEFKTPQGINLEGFVSIFNLLKDVPPLVVDKCFKEFDLRNTAYITFRDFCVGLARILLADKGELCKFIFRIFDVDNDGYLNEQEISQLFTACFKSLRILSIDLDKNLDLHKTKLASNFINPEQFQEWAIRNLELESIRKWFEVIPTPSTEKEVVIKLQKQIERLKQGQVVFLLSALWWEVWKAYVHFDNPEDEFEESHTEFGLIGPANRAKTIILGDRPVAIDNSSLIDPGNKLKVKSGLIFKKDYVLVSEEAWNELQNWYGGGPPIPRKVINEQGRPVLELYPPLLRVSLLNRDGIPTKESTRSFIISKKETFKTALRHVLKVINRAEEGRLWRKVKGKWSSVQLNNTLEEVRFIDEEELMLECPITGKAETALNSSIRRYFEGENIEVQKMPNTWVPATVLSVNETHIEVLYKDRKTEVFPIDTDKIVHSETKLPSHRMLPLGPGTTGLSNLGNTCYMNTILQCIANTPLMKDFLTFENLSKVFDENSTRGRVALDLSLVISDLLFGRNPRSNLQKFIKTFSKTFVQFEGNEQHDCHEFLSILLDNLHEDLGRLKDTTIRKTEGIENPTLEQEIATADRQWQELQGSGGSVVSDICGGQTRTILSCNKCGNTKVIFELFMNLSLPIPISMDFPLFVIVVLRNGGLIKLGIVVNKYAVVQNIVEDVAKSMRVNEKNILLAELFGNKIYTAFDLNPKEAIRKLGIRNKSELIAYEIVRNIDEAESEGRKRPTRSSKPWPDLEVNDYLDYFNDNNEWINGKVREIKYFSGVKQIGICLDTIDTRELVYLPADSPKLSPYNSKVPIETDQIIHLQILNTIIDPNTHRRETIGIPMIVSVGNWYNFNDLHRCTYKQLRRFISSTAMSRAGQRGDKAGSLNPFFRDNEIPVDSYGNSKLPYKLVILEPTGNSCGYCKKCQGCELPRDDISLKWIVLNLRKICLAAEWDINFFYQNITDDDSVSRTISVQTKVEESIEISECFRAFTKSEQMDSECEKCKEKDMSLQMEIWRVPDIMILCLKRFAFHQGMLDKLDQQVNFPLFAFDISEWVKSGNNSNGLTLSTTALQRAYDLFAVVNHSGSLSGGHYTAACLQEFGASKWVLFDDDHVSEVEGEQSLLSRNAYLLFYRRRKFSSSNVINLSYQGV
jgi:ubiquitin C-terminal hydrolase/Ca2+-binding EF-hand superfamily protein